LKTFRSNGKLLLTAEYAVLDGALALALPSQYGQSLSVSEGHKNLLWTSFNENNNIWFQDEFKWMNGALVSNADENPVSKRLLQIFGAVQQLNPGFIKDSVYNIETFQDFNRLWGLGTSSTLINNIAQWAKIDPYELLKLTFGGSGYDIACAQNNNPITYRLTDNKKPTVEEVEFNPNFQTNLYFVYLEQKQDSRSGIKAYRSLGKVDTTSLTEISAITHSIINTTQLDEFNSLIDAHENIIAHLISEQPIKTRLFKDFNGSIKSLGAWGGDFILVSSKTDPTDYFSTKGYKTIIPYRDMVL